MIKTSYTRKAANPQGYSSQAVEAHEMIFLAGTYGVLPETNELAEGGIEAEVPVLIENMSEAMKHSFSSWSNTIKLNIYLTNIDDFELVNSHLKEALGDTKPVFTVVEVSRLLVKGASVCIDGIISTF